ncbi:hypothetical protein IF2G_10597 [Cordyceps javanica]|nr:hypothetical protein IF2G_10597 [Cordyceps javanica]
MSQPWKSMEDDRTSVEATNASRAGREWEQAAPFSGAGAAESHFAWMAGGEIGELERVDELVQSAPCLFSNLWPSL